MPYMEHMGKGWRKAQSICLTARVSILEGWNLWCCNGILLSHERGGCWMALMNTAIQSYLLCRCFLSCAADDWTYLLRKHCNPENHSCQVILKFPDTAQPSSIFLKKLTVSPSQIFPNLLLICLCMELPRLEHLFYLSFFHLCNRYLQFSVFKKAHPDLPRKPSKDDSKLCKTISSLEPTAQPPRIMTQRGASVALGVGATAALLSPRCDFRSLEVGSVSHGPFLVDFQVGPGGFV